MGKLQIIIPVPYELISQNVGKRTYYTQYNLEALKQVRRRAGHLIPDSLKALHSKSGYDFGNMDKQDRYKRLPKPRKLPDFNPLPMHVCTTTPVYSLEQQKAYYEAGLALCRENMEETKQRNHKLLTPKWQKYGQACSDGIALASSRIDSTTRKALIDFFCGRFYHSKELPTYNPETEKEYHRYITKFDSEPTRLGDEFWQKATDYFVMYPKWLIYWKIQQMYFESSENRVNYKELLRRTKGVSIARNFNPYTYHPEVTEKAITLLWAKGKSTPEPNKYHAFYIETLTRNNAVWGVLPNHLRPTGIPNQFP